MDEKDILFDATVKPSDILAHHGILGQKLGVRRFQNEDGSLTEAGRKRYLRSGTTSKGHSFTIEETEPGKFAKFLRNRSRRIKSEADKSILATIKDENGKEIGDLQLYDEGNDSLNVNWIGINKTARGKGYASAVMKDTIKYAKEKGYKQMTLEVPGDSPDARHIYEKLGFTEVTALSEEDDVWGGLTAMVLNLDELKHYGILGQKWGIRRYQNPDGSLTPAGKKRYASQLTDEELRKAIQRKQLESRYAAAMQRPSKTKKIAKTIGTAVDTMGKAVGFAGSVSPNATGALKNAKTIGEETSKIGKASGNLAETFGKAKKYDLSGISDSELQKLVARAELEKQYDTIVKDQAFTKAVDAVNTVLATTGSLLSIGAATLTIYEFIKKKGG